MAEGNRNRESAGGLLGLPLVVRFVASGLLLSLLIWLALDAYQSRQLHALVSEEYSARLHEQARDDRLRFDETVRAQFNLVRILADSIPVREHMREHRSEDATWTTAEAPDVPPVINDRLPRWLPPRAVMRQFPLPDFLVVMDARDRVREVYRAREVAPPRQLLSAENRRLLRMSERQPLFTRLDDMPYLLSTALVEDGQGRPLARLLAASVIDDAFLLRAEGLYFDAQHIVALVYGEPPVVIASSDEERLAPGTPLSAAQHDFLVAGKAFFDYGAAEIKSSFITLVPRSEVHRFVDPIMTIERGQRTLLAATLIGFFLMVLLLLSNRIRALIERVGRFTEQTFGLGAVDISRGGDELRGLEEQFERLANEVMASRQALQEEAREKLRLLQEQLQVRAENQRLQTLHSVTDFLGVGVLRLSEDGPVAENAVMARFVHECGGIQPFLRARIGGGDVTIRDLDGRERLFDIARPAGMEAELLLVQDVTKRRQAEKTIESLARFPQQNPWPILRILADGIIERANPASGALLQTLGTDQGGRMPEDWQRLVREALATGRSIERDIEVGKEVLSLVLVPVTEEGYVNAYGTDVTARKRAELALQKINQDLERRVAERTEELRRKVAELLGAEEHLRRAKDEAEIASRVKTEGSSTQQVESKRPHRR